MRLLLFAGLFGLFSTQALADDASGANAIYCEVNYQMHSHERGSAKASEVAIYLEDPQITLVRYKLQDDGQYAQSYTRIISSETVSSWRLNRSECKFSSGYKSGHRDKFYHMNYSCSPGVGGELDVNLKSGRGLYREFIDALGGFEKELHLHRCRTIEVN